MLSRIALLSCLTLLLLSPIQPLPAARASDAQPQEGSEESPESGVIGRRGAFDDMNAGLRAFREERYAEAVDYLTRAAKLNKLSPKPTFWLGKAHLAMAHYDEARVAFERTLEIDDSELRARVGLGESLFHLGRLDQAREILESVQQHLDPPGVRKIKSTIQRREGYAPAHVGLGKLYAAQSKDEQARNEFETAIRVDATYVEGLVAYGDYLRERGDLPGAEALYLRSISVQRSFVPGYIRLGQLYLTSEMYLEAGGVYRRLLEERPESDVARLRLSEIALLEGDTVGATRFLASVSASPLYQLEADALLAQIYSRRGDHAGAIAIIDQALAGLDRRSRAASEPMQSETLWRIRLGRRKVEYAAALDLMEPAATSIGDDRDLAMAFDLGVGLLNIGDAQMARIQFETIVGQLQADDAGERESLLVAALVNLGVAETILGNLGAAAAAHRLALERDSDQADARLYLANTLYRTGASREALRHYEEYLRIVNSGEVNASRKSPRLKVTHLTGVLRAELEAAE